MSETVRHPDPRKSKPKAAPAACAPNVFEMPKFEMPKMEVPAAFREIAEKGISMAKENYEKMKSAAEEATDMLEETYSTASKGCSGYGLKLIDAARANSNADVRSDGRIDDREVLCRGGRALHRLHA